MLNADQDSAHEKPGRKAGFGSHSLTLAYFASLSLVSEAPIALNAMSMPLVVVVG